MLNQFNSVRVFEKKGVIYIDYRKSGTRRRFSTKVKYTKSAMKSIQKKALELATEHYEQELENKQVILFKHISTLAVEEGRFNRGEHTHKDNLMSVRAYLDPYFGNMELKKIKPFDIIDFINNFLEIRAKHIRETGCRGDPSKISQSRFNKTYGVLKAIFDFAVMNDYIQYSPMTSVPRQNKRFTKRTVDNFKYYPTLEVEAILTSKHISPYLSTFLHFSFMLGTRTGETLGVTWDCIDFVNDTVLIKRSNSKGELKQTKTGTVRKLPIPPILRAKLSEWKKINNKSKYVFPNMKTGDLMKNFHHHIIKKEFKPLLEELGIEYKTLYATRASTASRGLEKNLPMNVIQELLGHSELNTTQRYYMKSGLQDQETLRKYVSGLF